ncbi:hypothetical protein CONLIGDRAFT_646845 [Coniochaeta ligniaria NRRL 30616]|uniref:Cora-domain-containing protein n=1 Tax=Coniochaeta ligniaria NRRL 30616 TaxID=1408157 RepID=A0A1J7IG72_9PEZI|nr:hypothetical protein CONLIGDRAFT_646845 [Coniochaeta ligniaria NRRL 30616]
MAFHELVLEPELEQVLRRAKDCCQNCTCSQTSLLRIRPDDRLDWRPHLDLLALKNVFASSEEDTSDVAPDVQDDSVKIFFISAKRRKDSYQIHVDPRVLTYLQESFGMSKKFLTDIYETEEWTRLDFGSYIDPGSDSLHIPSLCMHYGFWTWDTEDSSHSFVQFRSDSRGTTYFCVNFPTSTVERIVEGISQHPKSTSKLLFVDTLITDDILRSYRQAISSRNKQLISIERETDRSSIGEQTKRLHALSVSWHTIYKDLIDLEEQIKHMRQVSNTYAPYKSSASQGRSDGTDQLLHQLETKCQFYRRWAMTYRDRTTGRINLLHHLATQQDNRLNQHISNVTTQVALQTQRDSASMFTLAVVTTIFLPPTFVAGVFGTPFFDTGVSSSLIVSHHFWIFPAVAVPLTVCVLGVWLWWFRRRLQRDRLAIRKTQLAVESHGMMEAGSCVDVEGGEKHSLVLVGSRSS